MSADPTKISAADFQRSPGLYQDMALRGPVTITRNGRDRTVLLSAEEYQRLKRRDRRAIAIQDLSERQLTAIRNAKVPAEFSHLDDELTDWTP